MLKGPTAIALLAIALGAPPVRPGSLTRPFPRFPAWCHRADFPVAGKPVRAAVCRDARRGNEPGLVVLYGCGGFGGLDYRFARSFSRAGFATMYLDMFALTPPPGRRGFCGVRAAPAVPATWQATILAATRALASERGVDPRRIGLLGWSLGADLALAAATTEGARIAVVVAYSPEVFPQVPVHRPADPSTIVLVSGRGDARVVRTARAFVARQLAGGMLAELYVYPQGSHYWQGRQGRKGFEHAVAFLHRAL